MTDRQKLVQALDSAYRQLRKLQWSAKATPARVRCFTCLRPIEEVEVGHYESRRHIEIRWSDDNTRPQCHDCNQAMAGAGGPERAIVVKGEYRRNLIREIGERRVLAVEAAAKRTAKIPTYLLAELLTRLREELSLARKAAV